MLRMILGYGAVAGLIVGVPMVAMMSAMDGPPPMALGMAVGYATMLIALSAVFLAIKRRRDRDLGGVIRFWPAFGLGLAISAVAGVVYVLAWELALATTGADFAGAYIDALVAEQRARGASGEALARFEADMARFRADYANPLYRLPMTFTEIFPVGAIVSLVSAALLRNSRFMPQRRAAAVAG